MDFFFICLTVGGVFFAGYVKGDVEREKPKPPGRR